MREDSLIHVQEVIKRVPHFETFCSVEKLHELVERLRADSRFAVKVAGASVNGVPIHHVRFGKGSVKALFVGGPHAHEPIGSLTVYSLMKLLQQSHPALIEADVEWHIVPCIDPDGAILNEGWTQKPFTFDNFVRNDYLEPRPEQVDFSFPISYKKLVFNQISHEAKVLRDILDGVRPDYYFSLHNFGAPLGGAWYALSRDIGEKYYQQIQNLLAQQRITLQVKSLLGDAQFVGGMREMPTMRKYYDYLEKTGIEITDEYLKGWGGADSSDYLLQIKPEALVFIAELTCAQHPGDNSDLQTGQYLRQLNLRLFADRKFLATVILEEWQKTQDDLDASSAFYKKIFKELIATKEKLSQCVSEWYEEPLQHLLFNPDDGGIATERDRIQSYMRGTFFLGSAYCFVRLLKSSKQTPAVKQATEKLERVFDEAIEDLKRHIGFEDFKVIDCDRLAKVQLGSGLIALNAVLAGRR